MGSQIACVQTVQDESECVDALKGKHRLFAVPRAGPAALLKPTELGKCQAAKQLLFLEEDIDAVTANVREIEGGAGEYQIDRVPIKGLFIEWNRTTWHEDRTAQSGRFYFSQSTEQNRASQRVMRRLMRTIQLLIKKNSPMRSDERYPIYVGTHAWSMIQKGQARLVYPNGSPVRLVENVTG
jgi:hypothetical protein